MTLRRCWSPSPNHDARPAGTAVSLLVLHYTGMRTATEALERLCDPAAKVSAHYTVDEDGTVHSHVAEDRRAWHAGISAWCGATDINGRSIGIEIVNPGHAFGYRPFPPAQMAAVETLCLEILSRHPRIPPANVVGHSDIACPRKQDPGELFDWRRLAAAGIGLWPAIDGPPARSGVDTLAADGEQPAALGRLLAHYGYAVDRWGLEACLTAFHRHFRPARLGLAADTGTLLALIDLLRQAERPEPVSLVGQSMT